MATEYKKWKSTTTSTSSTTTSTTGPGDPQPYVSSENPRITGMWACPNCLHMGNVLLLCTKCGSEKPTNFGSGLLAKVVKDRANAKHDRKRYTDSYPSSYLAGWDKKNISTGSIVYLSHLPDDKFVVEHGNSTYIYLRLLADPTSPLVCLHYTTGSDMVRLKKDGEHND